MCACVALIVASQNFVAKTTDLPTTTIYTPPEDQTLRINLYLTESGSNQTVASLLYTDEFGEINSELPTGFETVTQTIRAKGGVPVQINASAGSGSTYSVYVVIEVLS